MICLICNGVGWLRVLRPVPVSVYGEPRTAEAARLCPICKGKGKVEAEPDRKTIAAGG
jgi:hypothetical protein